MTEANGEEALPLTVGCHARAADNLAVRTLEVQLEPVPDRWGLGRSIRGLLRDRGTAALINCGMRGFDPRLFRPDLVRITGQQIQRADLVENVNVVAIVAADRC